MSKVKVHVEYCGRWGYAPKYEALKREILKVVPQAQVTGAPGRGTSFEITINEVLVFSKLKLGNFPIWKDVVNEVEAVLKGKLPSELA